MPNPSSSQHEPELGDAENKNKPNASVVSQHQPNAKDRKLELEIRLLEEQLTPHYRRQEFFKALANMSGLLLALVAVIGGIWSAYQWFEDQRQSRDVRVEDQLNKALVLLSGDTPAQHAAAVTALEALLTKENQARNREILLAIANALPLETDPSVSNAMATFFENVDSSVVERAPLNSALKTLAAISREGVRSTDLWGHRPNDWSEFERNDPHGRSLHTVGRAMTGLLRKGAQNVDLSETYFVRLDLSALSLNEVNFDGSMLAYSNFTSASLVETTFNGADLEGTIFVSADARRARFTVENGIGKPERHSYLVEDLRDGKRRSIGAPDFSCADLRNASFSGQALFFVAGPVRVMVSRWGMPDFSGANLKAADFSSMALAFITDDPHVPFPMRNTPFGGQQTDHRVWVFLVPMAPESQLRPGYEKFRHLFSIFFGFRQANWREGNFPMAITQLLSNPPITSWGFSKMPDEEKLQCIPRARPT